MATQARTFKTVAASVAVAAAIALAFCAPALVAEHSGQGDAGQDASQVAVHVVEDSVGRKVSIPVEPQHIAALDSFSGNVCALLGVDGRIYGAPGGVRSNKVLQKASPALAACQKLSGNEVNVEALSAGGVDLVFVRKGVYADGEGVKQLDRLKIPYLVVDYTTVDEQLSAVELVGKACGGDAAARGEKLAACYRDIVSLVEERVAKLGKSQRKRVYHSINDALLTDASGSLGADWLERSGLIDVSAEERVSSKQGDYTATLEQVYSWAPDLILCNAAGAAEEMRTGARWTELSAVETGEVHVLPVSAGRWGQRGDPETCWAMLFAAKAAYPDLFADVDLEQKVRKYYSDVIGISLTDEEWGLVLAGEGLRDQGNGGSGNGS